jgi:hypothetical protein
MEEIYIKHRGWKRSNGRYNKNTLAVKYDNNAHELFLANWNGNVRYLSRIMKNNKPEFISFNNYRGTSATDSELMWEIMYRLSIFSIFLHDYDTMPILPIVICAGSFNKLICQNTAVYWIVYDIDGHHNNVAPVCDECLLFWQNEFKTCPFWPKPEKIINE